MSPDDQPDNKAPKPKFPEKPEDFSGEPDPALEQFKKQHGAVKDGLQIKDDTEFFDG